MADKTSVAALLADISRKHELSLGAMSEVVTDTTWLSTGNLAIDWVTGGGLPQGRSVELYGQPSSGKTTTALQAAATLQSKIIAEGREEYILYLDFEHAMDRDYAAALGLDVDHESFLLGQPHSMEQGAEAALQLIASGKVPLSIWDSVAAMAPIARLEGEFDQRTAAMNKARLMSGLLLQLTPLLHKHNSTAVFINHLMESVEMSGRPGLPPKVDTPGGKGLKFYASLRLEYRPMGNVKAKAPDALTAETTNQAVATLIKVKCVKNKCATPFREAEARISYGRGFDTTWSALQVLLGHKAARKNGAWYQFGQPLAHQDMHRGCQLQGESAVLAFARSHPDWAATCLALAGDLLREHADTTIAAPPDPTPSDVDEGLIGLGTEPDLS